MALWYHQKIVLVFSLENLEGIEVGCGFVVSSKDGDSTHYHIKCKMTSEGVTSQVCLLKFS